MGEQINLPDIVRAIAIDANAMPNGHLDITILTEISELVEEQELRAEVWVPEPALWEWAEHAFSLLRNLEQARKSAAKTVDRIGLDTSYLPAEPTLQLNQEALLADLEELVEQADGVRILRFDAFSQSAVQGIRDQVLVLNAGRRKGSGEGSGVKTGASDGAIFRLVEHFADGHIDEVVLLTGDRDAKRYFTDRDSPILVGSWFSLRGALRDLRPAADVEIERIEEIVRGEIDREEVSVSELYLEGGGAYIERAFPRHEHYLNTVVSLNRVVELESIDDIEITEEGELATAKIAATVQIRVEGTWWNDMDDQVEHDWEDFWDVSADLHLEIMVPEGRREVTVYGGEITSRP